MATPTSQDTDVTQRRAHARLLLSAPADMAPRDGGDDAQVPVHVIDISLSGVGFLHAALLPSGHPFVLRVVLPGQAAVSAFLIETVYCHPEPVRDRFRCGARILDEAAPGSRERLVDFFTAPAARAG